MTNLFDKVQHLLTAAAHEALAKTYGHKILERASKDSTFPMEKSKIEAAPGKDLAEKITHHIISHAPHDKYRRWMAHSYANGGIHQLTDLSKTGEALKDFHKHVGKLEKKDIGAYKGYKDLHEAVAPHAGTKSKTEEKKGKSEEFVKNGEASVVHDSPTTKVVIPHTEEASKHFGKNTQWCTAAGKSRNYFEDYKPHGNLMYFLNKKKNEKHAIFVPHKDFKDGEYQAPEAFNEQDDAMSPKKVMEHYPDTKHDVEKHVPSVAHKTSLGYDTDPDEVEKLVMKHVK
jgi:hypothetical protein